MKRESFQKASQAKLPPQPDLVCVDPIVVENTRFSKDRTHRYTLYRHWGDQNNYCVFIGMNPSGADEAAVDRTVNRCINFAQDWGFGALYMLNAFGLRATLPAELLISADPVGPDNNYWIGEIVQQAARVVVAWGKEGGARGRGEEVEQLLLDRCTADRVFCFGRNKDGSPKHPLYQSAKQPLIPYFEERV